MTIIFYYILQVYQNFGDFQKQTKLIFTKKKTRHSFWKKSGRFIHIIFIKLDIVFHHQDKLQQAQGVHQER